MGFGGVNFMTCQRLMNIDTLGGARHRIRNGVCYYIGIWRSEAVNALCRQSFPHTIHTRAK